MPSQAIGVVGFLKLEELIPALTALIHDSDGHVHRAAVSALAFSQMRTAAETITRALKDDDWMVREMAAETLGLNSNGALSADQLIACLDDAFWQVRLKAIRSLGKMKIERTVHPIGGCITPEQANLRKEAAAALGEIAIGEGEAYFALVANDPDPDVQKNARWALQHIIAKNANSIS
jgi:HEAT repeat protein